MGQDVGSLSRVLAVRGILRDGILFPDLEFVMSSTPVLPGPSVFRSLFIAAATAGLVACSAPMGPAKAHLPLLQAWFEDQAVLYVTTDVSDAQVAQAKGANFAPLLAQALHEGAGRVAGRAGATARVYGFVNFSQASVFASAPEPVGAGNQSLSYTPLWQLAEVRWLQPEQARELRSEEAVLAAEEQGLLTVTPTRVVLNCPIVSLPGRGTLPGVSMDPR